MKKSIILGFCTAVLVFSLTGCVTHYRDGGADYLKRPDNITNAPYYTEFEISEKKVVGNGEASVLFWLFQFSDGKYCQQGLAPRLSFFSMFAALSLILQMRSVQAKSSGRS